MRRFADDPVVRPGFTLIDTLAAVGAAGALLSLTTVALGVSRGGSQSAQDQANLMTIGQAGASYTADNDGWLVGSPGTSGRALLNDPRAEDSTGLNLEVNGLATQPFDWASPLMPYIAPDFEIPTRRDERFALTNGTEIPEYEAPGFDPNDVDFTPAPGPLGVFADPAQDEVSIPYRGGLFPEGIAGTAFQPQLASSYIAAREHLWWGSIGDPHWADEDFWGGDGTLRPAGHAEPYIPGLFRIRGGGAPQIPHRPYIDRVRDPSRKIFLANGTRYQAAGFDAIDHDVRSHGPYGGAFADTGAWSPEYTRAWPQGTNPNGETFYRVSFRRDDAAPTPLGHVLYYDGSVQLQTIDDVRRPEPWLPRGTALSVSSLYEDLQDDYAGRATVDLNRPYGSTLFLSN